MKAGSIKEYIGINEHYLDENLDNNDVKTDLALQIISSDNS